MRLGLVIPNSPSYSETFFRSKVEGLQNNGYDITLLVGHQKEPAQDPPCRVCPAYRIHSKILVLQSLRTFFVLVKLLLSSPAVVRRFWSLEKLDDSPPMKICKRLYINAHILDKKFEWLHFGFATMMLERENVARAIGAKMAVSFRGYDVCIYPVKNGFDCYLSAWSKVDKLHFISDSLIEVAQTKLSLPESVSKQKIRPAINVERFRRDTRDWGIHSPIRLLTVGRLHGIKGLDYSIEACARLKASGLDFQYTIVGSGEAYEQLRFMVNLLNLEDCVFLVGKKSPDEVSELMEESNIYIQPSVSEGFCNAVLEAQAAGLLCIVSDAGGLPENVNFGKTGWVVPKRDSEALKDKLLEVVDLGSEARERLRINAVERVTREFNIKNHINEWINFYMKF